MIDPLKPSVTVLVKLGSLAVHIDEFLDPAAIRGHEHDKAAMQTIMTDPEVLAWLGEMRKLAFLPVKR